MGSQHGLLGFFSLQSILTAFKSNPKPKSHVAPNIPQEEKQVMDSEASTVGGNRDKPELDLNQATATRRRSSTLRSQDRTSLILAYPAPVFTATKAPILHNLRPRMRLQLQELSSDRRPQPTLDVFSLAPGKDPKRFVSNLHKFCLGVLSSRDIANFGPQDIVLARSNSDDAALFADAHEASSHAGADNLNAELAERTIIAVLRPSTNITMDDARVWVARAMDRGSFEFTHADAEGHSSVARWILRDKSRRFSGGDGGLPTADSSDFCFGFSMVHPGSRRHPVLATLTPSSLEIKHHYHSLNSDQPGDAQATQAVDETTRKLIVATAVWLVLHLGWSSSYKSPHARLLGPKESIAAWRRHLFTTHAKYRNSVAGKGVRAY